MNCEIKKTGVLYAIGAYIIWGLFPIYWKWLRQVPALQLLCHRILWSWVILFLVILLLRQWKNFYTAIKQPKILFIYSIAAILISVNWLVYIWAIQANLIIEVSLGYFINPLVSILLSVIFLRENLRPIQWVTIIIAGIGVSYLAFSYNKLPLISLTLAFTFAFYGLIKKIAPLNSLYGLTLETAILFLPVAAYLFYMDKIGAGAWLHISATTNILLIGGGIVTIVPLLMFSSAARSINLSLIGFLQYISPTLQFLVGKFIYHETFSQTQLMGFIFIWIALTIFSLERLYHLDH